MNDPILTVEQVAEMLQVHHFTVLNYIKQGKIRAAQLGRVYRVRQSAVDDFLDEAMFAPSKIAKPKAKKAVRKTRSLKVPTQK